MKYFLLVILYLIFQVSLIAGDGIGPEISNSVKIVFEAVKVIVMTSILCTAIFIGPHFLD
jgi:isocitrate/isopropylmalate dehydrogenase